MSSDVIPCLLEATSEKDYLIDPDLCRHFDEIYKKAVDAWANHASWEGLPVGSERTRVVGEHAQLIKWLIEQPAVLRQRFLPYLKIGE